MSNYIIPSIVIAIIMFSIYKKNNAYKSFVNGAKTSFDLILTSLPYIVAIFIAIEIFEVSGIGKAFANFASPFFEFFGIPKELSQLVVLKNFSGCGSLAMLENIFMTYGVDSYIARAGCCIAGCAEATFYITAVFFSKTNVEKFGYGIPVAIIANFFGAVASCWITRII